MSNGIDWFRWHHGSVTDNKFPLVANKAGVRLGDVIVVWTFILEKASAGAVRGDIGQIDYEALDFMIGAGEGASERIMSALTDRGLVKDGRIASWERRQPKRERESDNSTGRVQEYRARKADNQGLTPDETPCNATERQETPREEKRREEKRNTIKPEEAKKRGARLPDDWHPTAEDVQFCKTERPDLKWPDVAKRFYDYWIAKTGKDASKLDWSATWRNWVRNEKQGRSQGLAKQGQSTFDLSNIDYSQADQAMQDNMKARGIEVPDGEIDF